QAPRPDERRPELLQPVAEIGKDAGSNRDQRERDGKAREAPHRALELLHIAEASQFFGGRAIVIGSRIGSGTLVVARRVISGLWLWRCADFRFWCPPCRLQWVGRFPGV